MSNMGVITEQGDLGLGFNEITKEESEIIRKNDEDQKENKE